VFFSNSFIETFFLFSGLYDSLPIVKILDIFYKNLPSKLCKKIESYVLSDSATIKSNIDWAKTEKELSYYNMTQCKSQLLDILTNIVPNENFVKIFHIYNNDKPEKSTEPTFKNTTKMIYKFLAYVYQRNIVASLVKYIILKPLLDKFETS
jgi:hypothetical protein